MTTDSGTDPEKEFEREWRSWLDRPGRQSPKQAAARVSELVRVPRQQRRPLWAIATAGAVVAVLVMMCLFPSRTSTELPFTTAPAPAVSDPVQPGEVLIWLDQDTPLYMHFQPPTREGGNKS